MEAHVYPAEARFAAEVQENRRKGNQWIPTDVMEELKGHARADGLWNLWLPESAYGAGLTNLEVCAALRVMGRSVIGPEAFNCSAPDTGNMEVLVRYGTEAQKREWLVPLLDGRIRSAFAMTEPAVASSDATNIESRIERRGGEYVLNGRKWWTSGAGDPRCTILIFMGKSDPTHADRHRRRSMILVPRDTPGVRDGGICRSSATTTRRTVTRRCCSRTCGCPRRTCCSAKAAALRSRRDAWVPGASIIACA